MLDTKRRLSDSDKKRLIDKQNGQCFYCGVKLNHIWNSPDDFNRDPNWACVDHKIAHINGGRTDMDNCVVACRACNSKKGAKNYTGENT